MVSVFAEMKQTSAEACIQLSTREPTPQKGRRLEDLASGAREAGPPRLKNTPCCLRTLARWPQPWDRDMAPGNADRASRLSRPGPRRQKVRRPHQPQGRVPLALLIVITTSGPQVPFHSLRDRLGPCRLTPIEAPPAWQNIARPPVGHM